MKHLSKEIGVFALLIGFWVTVGLGENQLTNQGEGAESMTRNATQTQYTKTYQAGQTQLRGGEKAEARKNFEEALKLATTGEERAKAQFGLGLAETNRALARAEFAKVLAGDGAPAVLRAQAQMAIGSNWRQEGWTTKNNDLEAMWAKARTAFAKVLDIPDITPKLKVDAVRAVAKNLKTFSAEEGYTSALAELTGILERKDLPAEAKACVQVSLGKCHFFKEKYAASRNELAKALGMDGMTDADKAEAQLYIGLGYYADQDYTHARPELQKVLTMPGASAEQTHAAMLPLRLRKLIPSEDKILAVLFIGASQTQGWDVPQIVETLAASAPAGRPRIITDQFTRGGTTITKFWEEGPGPRTAQARITAEPWDCVVFETHPMLFGHDNFVKYAGKFTDLIRAQNATPIFFEAPAFFRNPYPAQFQKIYDETMEVGKTLNVPVAPANYAWMKYLGPTPTPEQRMALYNTDAVHPSKQGAYLIACAIYSAITGLSPVGLTHAIPSFAPDGITKDEAQAFQEAAWQAFQESNSESKPAAGNAPGKS